MPHYHVLIGNGRLCLHHISTTNPCLATKMISCHIQLAIKHELNCINDHQYKGNQKLDIQANVSTSKKSKEIASCLKSWIIAKSKLT